MQAASELMVDVTKKHVCSWDLIIKCYNHVIMLHISIICNLIDEWGGMHMYTQIRAPTLSYYTDPST